MHKFLLFCGARTGSTAFYGFFQDMGVNIRFEPFRPSKWARQFDVCDELEGIYAKAEAVKHLYDHMAIERNVELLNWAAHKNLKILFLRRRNLVLSALSRELAFQTGWWWLRADQLESIREYASIELQPVAVETLEAAVRQIRDAEDVFKAALQGSAALEVFYSDVFNRPMEETTEQVRKVAEFVGLTDENWVNVVGEHFSAALKQNSVEVYERIPNWQEIKEAFEL